MSVAKKYEPRLCQRFENQQHITFAVLADGMGGHQAGDVASQMAVNNLGESWSNASVDSAEKSAQWLIQAIQKENEKFMNADNRNQSI